MTPCLALIGGIFYIACGWSFCYWLYKEKDMAVYICERCGEYKDGDWDVCVEHPTDPTALLCEDCAGEMEEERVEKMEEFRHE